MTVATPVQPNFTGMSAAVYKAAIDAMTASLSQSAGMYAPHEATPVAMTVKVDAGRFIKTDYTMVTNAQQTATITAAHATLPRIDRVVIDGVTGVASVIAGTPNASPVAPAITTGKLPVCQVLVAAAVVTISNSAITDERAFMANFAALLTQPNTWSGAQTINTIAANVNALTIIKDLAVVGSVASLRVQGYSPSVELMDKDGVQNWYMGVDDNDANKLNIARGYGPNQGGSKAITIDVTDNITIPASFSSTKAAASGYSRVTPNMIRKNDVSGGGYVNLARDVITLITGPAGSKGIILSLFCHARSANAIGSRSATIRIYSDSAASIQIATAQAHGREEVAVAAGSEINATYSEVHVKADASGQVWAVFSDDAGDQGVGSYAIAGYYD